MSFRVVLFGPSHYFWPHRWSAWFCRPDEHSTGGVGFKVPFLHVCFTWGLRKERAA